MTIAEFKKAHNLDVINFNGKSEAGRLVGSVIINGAETRVMTTTDFDKSKPAFIYKNTETADADTGEVLDLYWVSNKSIKPVLSL